MHKKSASQQIFCPLYLIPIGKIPARIPVMQPLKPPFSPPIKQVQDSDTCAAVGCYVRAARSALGLNQATLAELLGVNRTTLLRLEKGAAPLRLALCLSAIEVLSQLGAKSESIENIVLGVTKVEETLPLMIDFESMQAIQIAVEAQNDKYQQGIASLLGDDFVPPLLQTPLRRK